MLEYFRTNVKDSYIFKGFLVLLAASFGIWGVGDFMGPSALAPGVVMKAGEAELKTELVRRRYLREMDRFREAMGGRMVLDDLVRRSVMSSMMKEMTDMATLDAAARDVGVQPTRDQLLFDQTLSQNQYTESAYVELSELDLRRALLLQPVTVNSVAPTYLVNSLFAYRNETRAADTLLVPTSAMSIDKVPTDEDLKAVYDKNVAAFTAPEYRKLTVLVLSSNDIVKPENIADETVKAYYDENAGRYNAPETRRIAHLLFNNQEEAAAARAQAAPGDTLEALAAKIKASAPIDLGELTASSALGKTIAPAFQAPANEITQPVQTTLGWHLFEIKSITPEAIKDFDAVKEEIRKTIAADKGADAVYDASVQMEDALASGTPPAEVAKAVGARIVSIPSITAQGEDNLGMEVMNPIDPQNLVTIAFSTPVGKDSKLIDLPSRDGYYVVHVDEITSPTPKPLADVRADVAKMWETTERFAQAQALADKLAAGIGPSSQMSALETKDKKVSFAALGPLTRFGEGLTPAHIIDSTRVSPQLLEKLFVAKTGDVVVAPVATGVVVARLTDIKINQPTGSLATAQQALGDSVRADISSNLVDQMMRAFNARYPVQVDQAQLDAILASR